MPVWRAVFGGVLLLGSGLGVSLAASTVPAGAVTAATLYVTTSGSGTACAKASPCGSISQGIATATGGSYAGENMTMTIEVAAGTYDESTTVDASSLHSLTIAGAGSSSTEYQRFRPHTIHDQRWDSHHLWYHHDG